MLKSYHHYPELNRVPVIDVPITGTNMSECVDFISHNIDNLHGEYICVSNVHTSVMAHDDPSYWSCHYFYGNEQKNLEALKESLQEEYPGLEIAGMEPSVFRPLSEGEKRDLSRRIADSGADFAWIALGAPRQEVLMHELKGGPQPLMIGVGGAFNVLAGVVPEAPIWMQNLSLEWLYRLMQEPKRLFKRYLVTNTKFLFYQFTGAKRKEGK